MYVDDDRENLSRPVPWDGRHPDDVPEHASRHRKYPIVGKHLPEEDILYPWKRSFVRMPPAAYRTFHI
ncbi:MAG: hypothetical protein ACLTG0_10810 [Oscillibacter sp.]